MFRRVSSQSDSDTRPAEGFQIKTDLFPCNSLRFVHAERFCALRLVNAARALRHAGRGGSRFCAVDGGRCASLFLFHTSSSSRLILFTVSVSIKTSLSHLSVRLISASYSSRRQEPVGLNVRRVEFILRFCEHRFGLVQTRPGRCSAT